MAKKKNHDNKSEAFNKSCLGNYPGKTLHRLGTAIVGIWLTSSLINFIWPLPDQISPIVSLRRIRLEGEGLIIKPITILILGISEIKGSHSETKKFDDNIGKLKSISIVTIEAEKPLIFKQLPTNLKLILPGSQSTRTLSECYEEGGVALSTDIIAKLLKLKHGEPQRYLITKPGIINKMANTIGGIMLSSSKSFESINANDKWSLNPSDPGKMNEYSIGDPLLSQPYRYGTQRTHNKKESILIGFWQQLRSQESILNLNTLTKEIMRATKTNLTQKEILSLASTFIDSDHKPLLLQLKRANLTGLQE